ncbi:hypothetical protein ACFV1X_15030 [Streptomyces coelicoflavus]|uniref:hypothetical protein n=1 Tax=Streptomyces coelicoflavus TaxID=285562 RepID=UPI0036AFADB3
MAALQAKAGNRAVTTAIQRATVTSPGPETTDEVRASSSRTPEAAASGSGQAQGEQQQDDAARRKQAAEDEAKDLKKQAGTAALTRADAEAQMWRKTGVAAAARKEATAAEGEAAKSRDKTDAAERERAEAEGRERDWAVQVEEAEKARSAAATTVSDRTGDETAAGKRQAEARDGLADAEAEVQRCTEEADTAAKELAAVEAEVERRRKKAEATAKELADAEAEVERCTKESDDAVEAHRRAEASLEALASAEDEAQKQAKQAAEAAHAAVETWATAVTAAKEQVVALQRKAEKRQGKVEAEEDRQREAEAAVRERAGAVTSAEKEVDDAQDVLRKRSDEFAAATRAREDAEATLTTREETKAAAEQQVSRAAADRERQENAKAAAQQEVARFEATASAHRRVEKDAREAAGAAARVRQQAGQDEAVAREGATEATKRAGEAAGQTEQTEQTAEPEKPGRLKRFSKAFGFTNLKKMGDPGDTVILRGTAPSGAAARAAASDAHRAPAFGTPSQQVFESSHNFGITALGLGNDSRGLVSALKTPKDTQGSAAHQADKDKKGKSAGVLTNATMLAGDGMKVGGGAATKSGIVEGVTAAGEGVGVTTGLFSVGIGAREGRAIHLTSQKRDALKKHALKDVEAVRTRTLQVVLDRLGAVNAELVDKAAAESGSEAGPTAEQIDSLDRSRAEVASLRTELREHLASAQQYAIHKQDNKIIKRAVSLGGNVVRTAGGILVVITLAGTLATPAAPAVGATGAAVLGGLAAYKGGKGGYKRAESVRHPDKWRRTTMAQGDTEFTEAGEEQKGSGWRAALEAVKVTKSIEQGERQLRAQEIYALAAGPAVPVGRNVPEDIRAEARGLLLDLKCDPARRNENAKEWSDSLNDPEQQEDWEKYIAKQLAS